MVSTQRIIEHTTKHEWWHEPPRASEPAEQERLAGSRATARESPVLFGTPCRVLPEDFYPN